MPLARNAFGRLQEADGAASQSLGELYKEWRDLEERIALFDSPYGAFKDHTPLDDMTNRQSAVLEAIAEIRAVTTAELLIKMTVWALAAPDASPETDYRDPSDILAYSVYIDLAAIERGAEAGRAAGCADSAPLECRSS